MKTLRSTPSQETAMISLLSTNLERAWINAKGDSMTADSPDSIPHGSRILIRRLSGDPFEIPLRKPVVLMGEYDKKPFLVCKLITFIDLVNSRVRCESLNKKYQPFWISLYSISAFFEVEEVTST